MSSSSPLSDRPINESTQDLFRRAPYAQAIAAEILASPLADSFVVGILGPWGSGKSSLLNMLGRALEKGGAVVVPFNPWLFSGTEQLVSQFFAELSAELQLNSDAKTKAVGEALATYGGLLAPLKFIPVVGVATESLRTAAVEGGKLLQKRSDKSVRQQRKAIEDALIATGKRFVVLIDDLDRLAPQEVRDVVRLVRLTADFPNVAYVLAFDRERVERHLDDDQAEGRAYLEKILQITHLIPAVRESDLARLVADGIMQVLEGRSLASVDDADMLNVFTFVIRPLFRTPRDVRRYLGALPTAFDVLGVEVCPTDVLGLEALRVLRPELFAQLVADRGLLTDVRDTPPNVEGRRQTVAKIFELAGVDREAVRQLLTRLFPASRRYFDNYHASSWQEAGWHTARRVASRRVLNLYLEKSYPEGTLAEAEVQGLFDSLSDRAALKTALEAMDDATFEHVLERLQDYRDQFTPQQAALAVPVLLNTWPRLRPAGSGFAAFMSPELQLIRVVLRMLENIKDQGERDRVILQAFADTHPLSARLELLLSVGHEANAGSKLVTVEAAQRMEGAFMAAALATAPSALAQERNLPQLLYWVSNRDDAEAQQWLAHVLADPNALTAVLTQSYRTPTSQPLGDVGERTHAPVLDWDGLSKIFGGEALQAAIGQLPSPDSETATTDRAIALAKRYTTGWRPPSPFQR